MNSEVESLVVVLGDQPEFRTDQETHPDASERNEKNGCGRCLDNRDSSNKVGASMLPQCGDLVK